MRLDEKIEKNFLCLFDNISAISTIPVSEPAPPVLDMARTCYRRARCSRMVNPKSQNYLWKLHLESLASTLDRSRSVITAIHGLPKDGRVLYPSEGNLTGGYRYWEG